MNRLYNCLWKLQLEFRACSIKFRRLWLLLISRQKISWIYTLLLISRQTISWITCFQCLNLACILWISVSLYARVEKENLTSLNSGFLLGDLHCQEETIIRYQMQKGLETQFQFSLYQQQCLYLKVNSFKKVSIRVWRAMAQVSSLVSPLSHHCFKALGSASLSEFPDNFLFVNQVAHPSSSAEQSISLTVKWVTLTPFLIFGNFLGSGSRDWEVLAS